MLLEMAADGMGDRVAVGAGSDAVTYAELLERSQRMATVIKESGVERVGSVGANSDLIPTLLFASGGGGRPVYAPQLPLGRRPPAGHLQPDRAGDRRGRG